MKIIILALLCLCMLTFVTVNAQQTVSGCEVCQFFVKQLENQVEQYEGQITAQFKKQVCGKLNKFEAPCNKFVDIYGPKAIKYLINEFDKLQVCNKLRLCKSNAWIKEIMDAEEAFALYQEFQAMAVAEANEPVFELKETAYCGVCEFAVSSLEKYANSSEIEAAALKLCKKVPAQYEQICDTIILMYLPNIIENILAKYPPHKVCCMITLCKDNCNDTKPVEVIEQPKIEIPNFDESNDATCALCQFAVGQAKEFLKNNNTKESLKRELNLLCSKLPTKYAQQCIDLVDNSIEYMIYYIDNNFSNEEICQLIGQCPKNAVAPVAPATPAVNDQSTCMLCNMAMTMLEQYINANSTDVQIKAALKSLCEKLSSNYAPICIGFVDTYEPILIAKIREYIASHKLTDLCKQFGLCPAKQSTCQKNAPFTLTNIQKLELEINENNKFCTPCMAVVALAEQELSKEATRQMIKDKLNSLCDMIPSENIAGLCKIVVAGKTDELIDGILARASPSEVCTAIRLCGAKKQVVEFKPESALTCGVCKEVVSVAVNYIKKESTITEIKNVLENVVCNKLPNSFKATCTAYVEKYAEALIAAFAEGVLNPDAVCQRVGACPKKFGAFAQKRRNKIRLN